MFFKLLIIAAALLGAFAEAQNPPWGDDYSINNEEPTPKHNACNVTFCHYTSCEGAAPPPVCPSILPECPTGCACYMDCPTKTLICFMNSHCAKIRRFQTKRRHARAASQSIDHQELLNSSESTVAHASIGSMERGLSASTAVQAISYSAEQPLPESTVSEGISGPEIPESADIPPLSERVERDISEPTIGQASQGAEQNFPNTTVPENVHAAHGAVKLVQDYSKVEKAAEAAAEKAGEAAVERAAVKKSKVNKSKVKVKFSRAAKGVVMNIAAASAVFSACFYRCITSLL